MDLQLSHCQLNLDLSSGWLISSNRQLEYRLQSHHFISTLEYTFVFKVFLFYFYECFPSMQSLLYFTQRVIKIRSEIKEIFELLFDNFFGQLGYDLYGSDGFVFVRFGLSL